MDLHSLFDPRSVAVFGVGSEERTFANRTFRALAEFGFVGEVYPVNPKHQEVDGQRCFETISDVPDRIDLAVVATRAEAVPGVLRDCATAKVSSVLVHSAGFNEVGGSGSRLQREIAGIAKSNQMRILGPNCLGFYNLDNGAEPVVATASSLTERLDVNAVSDVSFVTQSGGMGSGAVGEAARIGLTFRHFLHTGNEADVTVEDCMRYLADTDGVRTVCLFVEQIRNPAEFAKAASRLRRTGRDLIAVVAGRSAVGARASRSHTGAIAANGSIATSFLRQLGVTVVEDLEEMIDAAGIAISGRTSAGSRVGILTASGGAGAVLSDILSAHGFEVPELENPTKRGLSAILPDFSQPENPVDLTGQVLTDPGALGRAADVLIRSDNVDSVAIVLGLLDMHAMTWAEDIARTAVENKKPVVVCWLGALDGTLGELRKRRVPVYTSLSRTARALTLGRELHISRHKMVERPTPPLAPQVETAALRWRGEHPAKELLKSVGIPVPAGGLAKDLASASKVAAEVGYPVAVKIHRPDLLHKSELDGVNLDIRNDQELQASVSKFLNSPAPSSGRDDSVLVEEYCSTLFELIVGSLIDPTFGPVLMIGSGGYFAEVAGGHQFATMPVTGDEIREMLDRLTVAPLLDGWRNQAQIDLESLLEAIQKFADLSFWAAQQGVLSEMEINPLAVRRSDGKPIALDVLLVEP